MKHLQNHESLEPTPPRTPACTLEEARQLLADLKAEYDLLSPTERTSVREVLQEAAAQATSELPPTSSTRILVFLPAAKAYWWHVSSAAVRLALLLLNFICDPITVLTTLVSGLWKPSPRESDSHVAN